MKGHADIIAMLNEVLCGELTAINQYFLHARMCNDWGYKKIGEVVYHESIDEMKHAKEVTDRILFLEGLPNLQKLETLEIGEKVHEMLKNDLRLEEKAIPRLKKGIELCQKHSDHGTRHLLEEILRDEERHVDWLESQLHIIGEVGIENYLTEQFKAGEMS